MPRLRSLRALNVVLTSGCNLSCSYCYQNAKSASRSMTWPTLRAALDLLAGSRHDDVKLTFYGGEPLLRFDLMRKAVGYLAREAPSNKNIRYSVITNGLLLEERQSTFLADHRIRTQLSFDGVPAAQALRGEGTFDILDARLDRLRRAHPTYFQDDLHVLVTLLPSTVRHLAESFEYLAGKGIQSVYFSPQITDTSDWQVSQIDDLRSQFARVYEKCLSHYMDTGVVLLGHFRGHDDERSAAPDDLPMCGVGRGTTLTVDADGTVLGCAAFSDSLQTFAGEFLRGRFETLKLGRLGDPGFPARLAAFPAAARAAEIFDDKRDKYSTYGRCGDCRHLETCSLCPVSIGHIPGNDDPRRIPDFMCAFSLALNRYRDRFPKQPDALDILLGERHIPAQMQELWRYAQSLPGGSQGGSR